MLVVLLLLWATSGCMSPERRYRVLTFFFDDVPPPRELTIAAVPTEELPRGRPVAKLPEPRVSILSVHGPYAQKACNQCHGGRFANRLLVEPDRLCWECHLGEDFPGDVVHGPTAGGLCLGCHDPHRSPNDFLLVKAASSICGECHTLETFEAARSHPFEDADDCLQCHDPHATDREYMLRPDVVVPPGRPPS